MIEFVWPQTNGEWLAWSSAFLMVVFGLWMFFAPRRWLSLMKLQTASNHPEAVAEMRGPIAGASFGLGLAVLLLHPQPLLYMALGSALFFSALGRLVSIFVDKGNTRYNWIVLTIEGLMAFFPLAYAFGLIV